MVRNAGKFKPLTEREWGWFPDLLEKEQVLYEARIRGINVNRPLADIRHELRDYLHSNPATNAEELE
jgi:hypothetical protein